MKHTQAEIEVIIKGLIMDDGLTAVLKATSAALKNAASDAYRDYEATNLRSSLDLAKAWKRDADEVRECLAHIQQPVG
jgi:hypothetical protein